MSSNKIKIITWVMFAAITAFCLLLWYGKIQYRFDRVNYTEVYSSNGVWNLKDIDFSNTVVHLQGNVMHIPDVLLTPEQFEQNIDSVQIGNPIDKNEARTAKLVLIMPDSSDYKVYTKGDYARRLYTNGEFRGQVGVPALTAEEFEGDYGTIEVDTFATDNVIELVIQGGNFIHQEGSNYSYVLVGKTHLLDWFFDYTDAIGGLVEGMLLVLFILHFMAAVVFVNKSQNLCFAFICLTFALRNSLAGSKLIFTLFPDAPWPIAFRLEYLTMIISSLLILWIIYSQFKDALNRRVINAFLGIFLIFGIIFMVINTYELSHLVITINILYFLAILYIWISLGIFAVKRVRAKQPIDITQKISIMAVSVMFLAIINDMLLFNGFGNLLVKDSLAELAVLIFAIFEALAIFYATMKTVQISKDAQIQAVNHVKTLEGLDRMKTEFLQDMSHEMKTPLTVIATGIDYADRQLKKSEISAEKTSSILNMVREETARLGRMVGGMVSMAAMNEGTNRRKIDFEKLLRNGSEAFYVLAEKNGTKLIYDIKCELPPVFVDYDSFARVIANIMTNAIRHTFNGEIRLSANSNESVITVEVSDTGGGIDSDLLDSVTQRGVSHSGGTGLGLYICKSTVQAHGGEIKIDSIKNKGTTVTFTLPVYGGQEEGHMSDE